MICFGIWIYKGSKKSEILCDTEWYLTNDTELYLVSFQNENFSVSDLVTGAVCFEGTYLLRNSGKLDLEFVKK